jgi:hypothetical protein
MSQTVIENSMENFVESFLTNESIFVQNTLAQGVFTESVVVLDTILFNTAPNIFELYNSNIKIKKSGLYFIECKGTSYNADSNNPSRFSLMFKNNAQTMFSTDAMVDDVYTFIIPSTAIRFNANDLLTCVFKTFNQSAILDSTPPNSSFWVKVTRANV